MKKWNRNVELWPIDKILPFERNAKLHDVERILNTILLGMPQELSPQQQQRYIIDTLVDQPIVADGDGIIVKGHGRRKAAIQLGLTEFPVIVRTDLTPEQIRLARLADNRSSEGGYNSEKLAQEIDDLMDALPEVDFEELGLGTNWLDDIESLYNNDEGNLEEGQEEVYSKKIEAPIYEITGDKPEIQALVDTEKSDRLIDEIQQSSLPEEEKTFLIRAAYRHDVFNFENVAEYYAHSKQNTQQAFEASMLIIIDFDAAIEQGYSVLMHDLEQQYLDDYHDET